MGYTTIPADQPLTGARLARSSVLEAISGLQKAEVRMSPFHQPETLDLKDLGDLGQPLVDWAAQRDADEKARAEVARNADLWLERCPTLNELHMARRKLARENRMPRDGRLLVCSIPEGDVEIEVRDMVCNMPYGAWFRCLGELDPYEVARIDGWSIRTRAAA